MATREEMLTALRNADAAGDAEAATRIAGMLSAAPQQTAPARQPDSFLSRVGTGLMDPIVGAAQIADKAINPIRQTLFPGASSMADVVKQRDAEYNAPEGFDAARMAGNVANPVSWMGGGAGAGRAALQGAFQSALAPVNPDADFVTEKAQQAGIGAAGGAVLSKALAGLKPTQQAQALMDQGIQPTVGQSLGGMANQIEQKASSIPFVGDAISYARRRAQNEFEAAALQRAVGAPAPVAGSTGYVPRVTLGAPKTLDEANAIASQKFNNVVGDLKPIPHWMSSVSAAKDAALANVEMTAQNKRILTGIVGEHLDPAKLQTMSGEELKHVDSQLGYLVRKYAGGSPADKTLADGLRDVQRAFRNDLNSMLPAGMEGALNDANTAWARLVPINKAASQRADEKITPRALQRAMASQARQDVSRMPPDTLVDNAVSVLGQTVPDSGTAGRLMLGGGGLVGSGTLGILPQYLGAGAAAYAGATRPVQRALVGNTAWQKALGPYDAEIAAAIAAALRGQGKSNE